MTKIYEFPNHDTLYDEASLWVAKLDRQLNAGEEKALRQWASQSPQHRELLFQMADMWDRMDSLSRLSSLFSPPTKHRPSVSYAQALSVAAAVLLMMTLGIWHATGDTAHNWSVWRKATPVDDIYETNIGEHSTVNLPDGSQLVLNTNSLITVKYTRYYRLFHLIRGEVHIQVAHDINRPLSIIAANNVVQAVGTAFNVQIVDHQHVELIVTEGEVLVAHHLTEQRFETLEHTVLPTSAIAISKGEKIFLNRHNTSLGVAKKIEAHDIEADLSWRNGNLIFRGETLEEALDEISRYTDVKFDIIDDNIKTIRIAGLFKAGDVTGLLSALEKNFHIKHEKLGPERISHSGIKN